MRNRPIGFIGALALVSTMATSACTNSSSSSTSTSTAGRPASGGGSSGGASSASSAASGGTSGSSSQPAKCPNGSACGGDLVGTWKVSSACLTLSGTWDVSTLGMGCSSLPITGTMQVTGTFTANADKTYKDNTTTKGSIAFSLEASCLTVSSIPVECSKMASAFSGAGWDPVTCSKDASGKCNCSGTAEQTGGIGVVVSNPQETGDYAISGNGLTTDTVVDYSYCVSGNTLTLTPKPTILPVTGTVVLDKVLSGTGGSAAGAGGSTTGSGGAGGVSGTGGSRTGGTSIGTGGGTSTGGSSPGTGGTSTGSGGRIGTGGALGGTSATAGTTGAGGNTTTGGTTTTSSGTGKGPCDIFQAANMKCAAAHSTVRALFGSYSGSLYQVKRASDSKTQDIGLLSPGGIADSSAQDTFCTGTTCVITKVYDQSGNGNFVSAQTTDAEDPSVRPKPGSSGTNMKASNAAKESFTLGGKKVYSLYMTPAQAYWRDGSKTGMPTGSSPQGIYMVTSGKHFGSGCCFDYGNGELSRTVTACGGMDAVNFSSNTMWGTGAGAGPWVMSDFECGLKAQSDGSKNNSVPTMTQTYVTAIEKNNGTSEFALRGADATTGSLTTFFKGKLPFGMKKEGAIVVGSGGDCCYSNTTMSEGTFYEGAIVAGYPTDATEDAVQANIVSAGYGK